jgi:lipopolysaccharide/colanic/teichoic acid biosynthesis glycosyltransferase
MQSDNQSLSEQLVEVGVEVADVRYRSGARAVGSTLVDSSRKRWWRDGFKLAFEWPLTLLLMLLLLPLFLIIALAILITTGSPVVYRRRVMGRGGVEFDAFKFRTMVNGAERVLEQDERLKDAFTVNWKLFSDPRVTHTGRVLRKYSLDELPQLVNVLRGEMSLIGPRMVSPAELPKYAGLTPKLLSVRPGLTGLWQVSGRQNVSYDKRIALDMAYVDQCSLATDLNILLRTIPVVLKAEGAF